MDETDDYLYQYGRACARCGAHIENNTFPLEINWPGEVAFGSKTNVPIQQWLCKNCENDLEKWVENDRGPEKLGHF